MSSSPKGPCCRLARPASGSTLWRAHRVMEERMQLSVESLLVILVVGLIAGWLAGLIVRGTGIGLIGDMAVGIVGAFIGSWLLPQLGIVLGAGLVAAIVNATIGAVILLLIIRLVQRGRGGRLWRR